MQRREKRENTPTSHGVPIPNSRSGGGHTYVVDCILNALTRLHSLVYVGYLVRMNTRKLRVVILLICHFTLSRDWFITTVL